MFNGVLYSITPWSVVYAVDARTGKEMWRSDPEVNQQVWQSRICCGVVNRGIALYQGNVIAPVVDGRLIFGAFDGIIFGGEAAYQRARYTGTGRDNYATYAATVDFKVAEKLWLGANLGGSSGQRR